ncbi:MAG: FAD-dependent oxidoreductase, partial [Parcubacteria group bacterium]|nr:FAD-dependent oxidoreductase [Parcubacteria group bacterium]
MEKKIYDLTIVGAGPAGMSAGIYAGRFRVNALVLSKDFGGTCNTAHLVENYPGYKSIGGMDLMMKFKEHLDDYKDQVDTKQEEVQGAKKKGDNFVLVTEKGEYETKSILLSSGTQRRKLNIEGEKEFLGKGVSYCATCDAAFFREKTVAIVGGSNSAVTAALLLAEHGKQVYLIYRNGQYKKAEPVWVERMKENKKITEINNTNVLKINGEGVVKSVELDKPYEDKNELNVDGVFIEIGSYP